MSSNPRAHIRLAFLSISGGSIVLYIVRQEQVAIKTRTDMSGIQVGTQLQVIIVSRILCKHTHWKESI